MLFEERIETKGNMKTSCLWQTSGLDTTADDHRRHSTNDLSLQRSILHAMGSEVFPKLFLHHGFVIGPVAEISPLLVVE
jgi:hypothetical protein